MSEQAPSGNGRATMRLTVGAGDTAQALGSGDVPVLGTPRLVALAEAACVAASADRLAAGQVSVGIRVEIRHTAPSPVGATVCAQAELVAAAGPRLHFVVHLTQGEQPIGSAEVDRMIVDRERFLSGSPAQGSP
jgi:fluoroacetyl-CoA thioesterase